MPGRGFIVILTALALAGCMQPEQQTNPAVPDQSGATTTAATEKALYSPKQDPLVNPASLMEPAPSDPEMIEDGETLYRNMDGNPSNLNPLFISSTYEFYAADVLFSGLFTFDADMQWKVNDEVVDSFEESADHMEYLVKMKPGLTWQDGEPFTADDVAFSFQEIMDNRVPCPAVRPGTDQLASVEAVDKLTVKFRHKEALPTNKWNVSFPIIPKHLYEKDLKANPDLKSGDYYEKLNRQPVGSGPYRFVEWIPNDKIVFERWEDFKGKKPHFKRMVFRIIPDANMLLLTFNKGEVDELRMSSKQFATQTSPDSDFGKVGVKCFAPQWAFTYIGWNEDGSNPFFNDVRVRRAMTYACNIPRMIKELTYSLSTPCYGIYHPNAWMFNPEVKLIPFDLKEAARLLDEAGWKVDENQGGWRYKTINGKPEKFDFTLLIPQGSSVGRAMAAIFQEDLKRIGVSMKTQIIEWATFMQRTRKHEFQASTAAWGTGTDPDTGWNLWRSDQWDKEGKSGRNYGAFKNKRVDELFDLARHEFDQGKRTAYYQEIQKIIYDEQPYTFLWNRGTLWGFAKRIRGVTTSPRGVFNFSPAEMVWWVKKGEAKYASMQKP